jgi:hypothetical protein
MKYRVVKFFEGEDKGQIIARFAFHGDARKFVDSYEFQDKERKLELYEGREYLGGRRDGENA